MELEKQKQLAYHAQQIGLILHEEYKDTFNTFINGEEILRNELLNTINPHVAKFFFAEKKQ